ncbi:helix-turn-helix domain-containing protein, partial [Mucilaginibacter sp.]|uniref:helix-turn-helix domain-containing protein n=1 Tax=Mucilaginibacter sp. TaxID=1882438 RepID=UPI002ED013BE
MKTYTFHISFYDLAFLGAFFLGMGFAALLWFARKTNRSANRFLAVVLAIAALWIARILAIDIRLETYIPYWSRLPMRFLLAFGPLNFFYVLRQTLPLYKFRIKDLLHFIPVLLELGIHLLEVNESIRTGATTYETLIFRQLNPALHLMAFISIIIYLYLSHRLIENFYQRIKFNQGDRYRYEMRWLHHLLAGFGLLWLFWVLFTATDYFYYHHELGIHAYYPLYLLLMILTIRTASIAFLRPEVSLPAVAPAFLKTAPPQELKDKGIWLKKVLKANLYYLDPELNLRSLAEKLSLYPNELSRIINTVLKKSFSDFINEYRVVEVSRKMQDPAYDHITLLGIAFESGFNSKTTFNRTFKQMTGKSPAEYKSELKKERPYYNLERNARFATVISNQEAAPKWTAEKSNRKFMFKNYFKIAWRNLMRNKSY